MFCNAKATSVPVELFGLIDDDTQIDLSALNLDFGKDFHTVSRELLLKEIQLSGISGNMLRIIASYLTKRVQFFKIDDNMSTVQNITSGNPQG